MIKYYIPKSIRNKNILNKKYFYFYQLNKKPKKYFYVYYVFFLKVNKW